ncbi:MAG TPA: CRISPR-associated endonuclease Cas2, partial [Chloroflexota bacterium]|nr:CRISPR-associated endonuclease Cas2 [Chloroflexota bacterium]
MIVVVSYDVPENRRRLRLHSLLKGYGVAVQRSVFECDLAAPQLAHLLQRARRLIEPADDDLRLYPLCEHCHVARTHLGPGPSGEQPPLLVL